MFSSFDFGVIGRSLGYLFFDGMTFRLRLTGSSRPIRVGAFASSLVTFIMLEAAYFSEIMRAGIQSISKGQPAAAQALGLTYSQTMRYVVLPQAFRNMLPVLLTQTIVLFQAG